MTSARKANKFCRENSISLSEEKHGNWFLGLKQVAKYVVVIEDILNLKLLKLCGI